MTETQMVLNCNKNRGLAVGSHLVNSIDLESAPPVNDNGSENKTGGKDQVLTSEMSEKLRIRDDGPSSGSKSSSVDTPRLTRKRRRDFYKNRSPPSDDESESGEANPREASGSGKGDSLDHQSRKKRQRRRKNRKYKPYNKLSWSERRDQEDRETRRANRVRAQRFANGQPVAPYNTTQFLMEDHGDLKDIDVKQGPLPQPHHPPLFPKMRRGQQRTRDSSFSLDSDEDFYYSSPEDEKEFLTKEFSSAYEDLHAEQLNSLPKTKLVQDILSLEKRKDELERELTELKNLQFKTTEGESVPENNVDERVKLYKREITKLSEENNKLRAENECLRSRCHPVRGNETKTKSGAAGSDDSSIDSESDSTASSSGSCSSSSCSMAGEGLQQAPDDTSKGKIEPEVVEQKQQSDGNNPEGDTDDPPAPSMQDEPTNKTPE